MFKSGCDVELLTEVSMNLFRYVESNGKFFMAIYFAMYRKQWKVYYGCRSLSRPATEENLRLMNLRKLRFLTGEE
jgi:hypothetical protein